MKKKYVKPEAEYISLEAKDVITDIIDKNGGASGYLPEDWE